MGCGKKFGKILKSVRNQYSTYSKKRQLKIAWAIYNRQRRKRG